MKIKQLFGLIGVGLTLSASLRAENDVVTTENQGATGTTSATVIVQPASGTFNLTDLQWRVDSANTSATVDIRTGKARVAVTSATAASGTALWFSNSSPTLVAAQDYVIYFNAAAGTYTLLKCTASTSTSITVQETISPATATADNIYTLNARIRRPASSSAASVTVAGASNLWFPANLPTALTVDGNTTSCQISISGVRSFYK